MPIVLSCDKNSVKFYFSQIILEELDQSGGICNKSAYCNDGPACGNTERQKAQGVAYALLLCSFFKPLLERLTRSVLTLLPASLGKGQLASPLVNANCV